MVSQGVTPWLPGNGSFIHNWRVTGAFHVLSYSITLYWDNLVGQIIHLYLWTCLFCAHESGICMGIWGDTVIVSAWRWLGTCVKSGRLVLVAPVTALLLKPSVIDLLLPLDETEMQITNIVLAINTSLFESVWEQCLTVMLTSILWSNYEPKPFRESRLSLASQTITIPPAESFAWWAWCCADKTIVSWVTTASNGRGVPEIKASELLHSISVTI